MFWRENGSDRVRYATLSELVFAEEGSRLQYASLAQLIQLSSLEKLHTKLASLFCSVSLSFTLSAGFHTLASLPLSVGVSLSGLAQSCSADCTL